MTQPARTEADGILFLHVRLTGNGVTLVDQHTVPGQLKARRAPAAQDAGLHLELYAAGDMLWSGVEEDPFLVRLEYVDEDGALRNRTIRQEEVELTVRVPHMARADRITFYRMAQPAETGKQEPEKQVLGSIDLAMNR
jgi:hypothetical protein